MGNRVFLAVLLAAFLHAGWNSVIKIGVDRLSSILLLALVQAVIAFPILPFVAQPGSAAWPWLLWAAILHSTYKVFLLKAYEHADLSQAYPVARGSAPLIVMLISVTILGASFPWTALLAVGMISAGILAMAMTGSARDRMGSKALYYAVGTAGFTASYSLVDGIGARVAATSAGFVLWMVIGDALIMLGYASFMRGRSMFPALLPAWKSGAAAGVMSLAAYWIVVWAFTQAPIALVAALRESSILFAALIAAFVLREQVSLWRWASTALIACGIALMRA
jgi:drug/metabolite transporter (DMT)-like permease